MTVQYRSARAVADAVNALVPRGRKAPQRAVAAARAPRQPVRGSTSIGTAPTRARPG